MHGWWPVHLGLTARLIHHHGCRLCIRHILWPWVPPPPASPRRVSPQSACVIVPGFCCHPPGRADASTFLGVGGHQVRAVIGSSWFLLLRSGNPNHTAFTLPGRQNPSLRAVETITPPPNNTLQNAIRWRWRDSNPRPTRINFKIQSDFALLRPFFTAGRRKPVMNFDGGHVPATLQS